MEGTAMAEIGRITVDMTELNAAKEKAAKILAMLDEIEGRMKRLDDLGFSDPIVASAPTTPPPPKSRR
jgi:hypothetical protein